MNIVLFDTETTGLLKPANTPVEQQPEIIEFYGVALNEEFEILSEVNHLIYPQEEVSPLITRITGIHNSDLSNKPRFKEVHEEIKELFENSDLTVAHNHDFDKGMVNAEFQRLDMGNPIHDNNLCTVEATMFMKGFRLSLSRLHYLLFQSEFNAHRAKDDVFALVRCFHKLVEDGSIDLDLYKN